MRPLNAFEQKNIMDYNKSTVLSAIRYNCVRAKELDDALGAPKTGSFLVAMQNLSSAITAELGVTVMATEAIEPTELEAKVEAQELELVEQDNKLDDQDRELVSLRKEVKDLTTANKKLVTSNKKLNKGAK